MNYPDQTWHEAIVNAGNRPLPMFREEAPLNFPPDIARPEAFMLITGRESDP